MLRATGADDSATKEGNKEHTLSTSNDREGLEAVGAGSLIQKQGFSDG